MKAYRLLEWVRKHCRWAYPSMCGLVEDYAIKYNNHRLADEVILSRDNDREKPEYYEERSIEPQPEKQPWYRGA